ncbi:uncharacterized protein EV422DRAFT_431608 [Fimicolochytrium jonesii]|uniref:uncharacterized protein n=1 Tax=Fimicolochytrium jonesii TaxID=1396493 RepID=UPI0022FE13CC|nr:uncharacterized protein EV422DRAFT_431608 [Fimicolochytrium jonesii]KAI8821791.1 hypothetical protein EV422DRAFT_431608 [Fimicolochytrium jonesii]
MLRWCSQLRIQNQSSQGILLLWYRLGFSIHGGLESPMEGSSGAHTVLPVHWAPTRGSLVKMADRELEYKAKYTALKARLREEEKTFEQLLSQLTKLKSDVRRLKLEQGLWRESESPPRHGGERAREGDARSNGNHNRNG